MNTLLSKTLNKIEEESGGFNESFALVDELVKMYGENDLANRIYSEINESTPWSVVANLFGILIWSTRDNGYALTKETEEWLVSADNPRKILIALNTGIYPFMEFEEMQFVLKRIINKYPSLEEQCNNLISSRRKQNAYRSI